MKYLIKMNSIVISLMVILISVLNLCETCMTSLVSVLILVFILNFFLVSKIAFKCKQSDQKLDNCFELKTNQINNSYYYYSVIYYFKRPFNHLTRFCLDFMSNKLSKYLTEVEKTLYEKPFCDNSLNIETELKVISHKITENYVDFWYQLIGTENQDFQIDCQLILQKMFLNLFERCEQKLNKQIFCQKFIVLFENHLNDIKSVENLSSLEVKENQRIDSIIERVFRLTATEDITCVISNPKSKHLSLVLMIKAMLSHSVFLPIIDIITEQKFIYENLIYLITNSELKLNDKNKTEYQPKNQNQINELFSLEFKDKIQNIDSTYVKTNEESFDKTHQIQLSNNSEEDNSKDIDLSGNESNDELIVEAIEAEEEISEKRISNLEIIKTEEINESYNSSYILYFIEYDGLFRHTIDSQISGSYSNQKNCLLRKRFTVQRRFSEFISLQKILERNKSFKRLMKGIKKPSSIQITAQNLLAFAGSANTRLDSSTVEFRRIYLQNFLLQLSNLKAITESLDFNEFLAFGSDGSIAFVSSNSDNIITQNIDKVFFRGVKGAISFLKSALPIEAQIGKIDPKFSEQTIPENEKLTIKSISTDVESNNFMQLEKKLNIWSQTDSDLTFINSFCAKNDNIFNEKLDSNDEYLKDSYLGTRTLGDGCEDPNAHDLNQKLNSNNEKTYQLNSSPSIHTISCVLILITKNLKSIERIIYIKIIYLIFGTTIERFVSELVSKLITKEMFVRHIHSLHSALWPTNESKVQNEVQNMDCFDQTLDTICDYIESKLSSISPLIKYIMQKKLISDSVKWFLANILVKFENCKQNKLLFYDFCELILDEIQ